MRNTGELCRAEPFLNKEKKLTIDQVYAQNVNRYPGLDLYVIDGHWQNGDGTYCGYYKVDGVMIYREPTWDDALGMGWDADGKPVMGWYSALASKANFVCTMPLLVNGVKQDVSAARYTAFVVRSCARPYLAYNAAGLYCLDVPTSGTPAQEQDKLLADDFTNAIGFDGGGSTKLRGPNGLTYDDEDRFIYNYMLLWFKPASAPEKGKVMKKVCLDAGHGGTDCTNGAPDKSYFEHEFTLDMALRTKAILTPYVDIVMTRETDTTVSLSQRAAIANAAGADIYVSIHSNAVGNASAAGATGGPSGLCIFTSSAGDTAGRNILARKLLTRFSEAGATLFGSQLYHEKFAVLINTVMPACLIEYGFHTTATDLAQLKSQYWRGDMALATARGILDYIGIAYTGADAGAGDADTDEEAAAKKLITAGWGPVLVAMAGKIGA